MTCGELIILDVGHGNCSIIKYDSRAIIIDAPGRAIITKALDELGITSIEALLISHADSDHLSGAIPILMNPSRPVKKVYINPDSRNTKIWDQFKIAAGQARRDQNTHLSASLNVTSPQDLVIENTALHILHPTPEMCLSTNNGKHIDGVKLDANSMSAVIQVKHNGKNLCLLAADSGQHSLNSMLAENTDLSADILVFPHHGGHIGGAANNKEFTKQLVSAVKPKLVLFSLGRGVHGTPRPEIISATQEAIDNQAPYIACTQLSKNCSESVPDASDRVLFEHSDGFPKSHCCAGSLTLPLMEGGLNVMLDHLSDHHDNFVTSKVPKALCRKKSALTSQLIATSK